MDHDDKPQSDLPSSGGAEDQPEGGTTILPTWYRSVYGQGWKLGELVNGVTQLLMSQGVPANLIGTPIPLAPAGENIGVLLPYQAKKPIR